jgi:hypothetical protein
VFQALRGGEALLGVDDQQLLDEVDRLLGDGAERFLVEAPVD